MPFTVRESIEIDRPAEDVWEYVTTHEDWRKPDVLSVRKLTEGPPRVGTRYEDKLKQMGREATVVNELIAYDPPQSMSWRQVDERGPVYTVEGQYRVEPLNGTTRFTLVAEYAMPGLWRLLAPFVRRQVKKDIFPRFLRQLKEALEGQRQGG